MNVENWLETAKPLLIAFALKVAGAIAAFIVGRMLIGFATSLVTKALERQKVDPTIGKYLASLISIALNIVLIVAILGFFGVE